MIPSFNWSFKCAELVYQVFKYQHEPFVVCHVFPYIRIICVWSKPNNLCYSHPLVSISIEELHVVAGLDPADGPRLLAGHRRHQDLGMSAEVRRPVAEHHAVGLVDAGGVGIDGGVHLQDDDTVSETLGLTPDTLDAAHRIKQQHNPQERREVWKRRDARRTTTDGCTSTQKYSSELNLDFNIESCITDPT